jgi:branched-chain amino acid transport system substrate-binding protein
MKRRCLIGGSASFILAHSAFGLSKSTDTWRICRSLPLTSPQAGYGEAKRDGGDAFAAMVNATGGIGGKRIVLSTADDGYDERRTVENISELASAHSPVAFAGFVGTPACLAAAAQLPKHGIPGVGFTTGSNRLREAPQREVFPVRASFAHECAAIVKHHQTTGVTQAVIAFVDIPFGRLARDSFESAARAHGMTLASAVEVRADGTNTPAAAAALRATGVLVLMALLTPSAIALAKELRRQGSLQQLWCLSAVDSTLLQQNLGAAARGVATSIIAPPVTRQSVPLVREYVAATAMIGKPATAYGLEAFVEMKALAKGLVRARSASAQDVIDGLEAAGRFDVGGIEVTYGPHGNRTGATYVDLVMISDAKVVG